LLPFANPGLATLLENLAARDTLLYPHMPTVLCIHNWTMEHTVLLTRV